MTLKEKALENIVRKDKMLLAKDNNMIHLKRNIKCHKQMLSFRLC